jgi:hypothetical protein
MTMNALLTLARGNKKLSALALAAVAAVLDQALGTDLLGSILPALIGM